MNLKQIAKNHMYKNVLGFFTANQAAFAAFARLANQIDLFTAENETLNNFIDQQLQTTNGFTKDKNNILSALISDTVKAARKALVYAVDENDEVLKALFGVHVTTLVRLPQDVALAGITNIYQAMSPLAEALQPYNVSTEDIDAINKGIINFKAAEPGTGNARAARKAATQGIRSTLASIDLCLGVLDDLIIHGIDNAALVNEYRNNRKIDTVGVRHTGIVAVIDDAVTGAPVADVKMEIAALNKRAVSDLLGVAEIIKMKPGFYEVAFSAEGFVRQTMILKIDRGVKLEVSVNLAQAVQEMELVKVA